MQRTGRIICTLSVGLFVSCVVFAQEGTPQHPLCGHDQGIECDRGVSSGDWCQETVEVRDLGYSDLLPECDQEGVPASDFVPNSCPVYEGAVAGSCNHNINNYVQVDCPADFGSGQCCYLPEGAESTDYGPNNFTRIEATETEECAYCE